MSKKANYKLIGAFVVGAAALLVGAIVIFGSGTFFQDNLNAVMFFNESVKGLQVGAPVSYRGVAVGVVKDIRILMEAGSDKLAIPVQIELQKGMAERIGHEREGGISLAKRSEFFRRAIDRGLKGQLAVDSMVTGQLYIQLDFFPDIPATFLGLERRELEIPTAPSGLSQLMGKIKQIPIDEIAGRLNSALLSMDKLLSAPELMDSVRSWDALLKDTRGLINNVDREILPLSREMQKNISDAAEETGQTLRQATKVFSSAEALIAKDAPFYYRVNNALDELTAAARSLKAFTDYLERHPEALLHGKNNSGGK